MLWPSGVWRLGTLRFQLKGSVHSGLRALGALRAFGEWSLGFDV